MADRSPGMHIPEIPKNLLGPTGKVFFHGDGYSTHMNFVTQLPNGKYAVAPLLTPNQQDIPSLFTSKPTDEHFNAALDHFMGRLDGGEQIPLFDSADAALAFENKWHDETEGALHPHVEPYLRSEW